MASDFATVRGRTGTRTSEPSRIIVTMGPQPAACAACIRGGRPSTSPRSASSANAFPIFVRRAPPAHGTTTWAGVRQPSCSAIS